MKFKSFNVYVLIFMFSKYEILNMQKPSIMQVCKIEEVYGF